MTLDQQTTKKRGKSAEGRETTEKKTRIRTRKLVASNVVKKDETSLTWKTAGVSCLGKHTKLKAGIMFGGLITGLGVLLTLARFSHQATEQHPSDYYTAAVVEFTPTYNINDGLATLRENANAYIEYIKEASQQNADIVVFPEDGLTSLHMSEESWLQAMATVIPSARDEYVPCTQNKAGVSETLKRLSCAAREHRIYVVVNIAEKRFCEPGKSCPDPSGVYYHNTNVAFDRTGRIVGRYRKVNLYMEAEFKKTEKPEIVTFDTDFGVKFGTFTCFDILFGLPALNLTKIEGVTDIVFTTAWFSELPFLIAPQVQFGWSFSQDVNFLASGYHQPDIGSAGSGIYLGRGGIANVTMSPNPEHRLLISRVPKKTGSRKAAGGAEAEPEKKRLHEERETTYRGAVPTFDRNQNAQNSYDWIFLIKDNVTSFKSVPFKDSLIDTVCHLDFCCAFDVRATDRSASKYRAVIFNGIRYYGRAVKAGVRLCSVIQCANDSLASCGSASNSDTTFTSLSVTATFGREYPDTLTTPNVLGSSLLPFLEWTYAERPYQERTNVTIALNKPTKNLVSFGIYSRDFTRDQWFDL